MARLPTVIPKRSGRIARTASGSGGTWSSGSPDCSFARIELAASIGTSGWSGGSDTASIRSAARPSSRRFVGEVGHADHLDQHPSGLFLVAVVDVSAPSSTISDACLGVPRSNSTRARTQASLAKVRGSPPNADASCASACRTVKLTGVAGAHRCGGQPLAAHHRVGGEPGGALVCGRTCRITAAAIRAHGRGLHRVGGAVVETDRRRGEMPGAPIGELRGG